MPRDRQSLLFDIAAACEALGRYVRGRTRDEYEADDMLQAACERRLEIIGEAMTRLRDDHPDVFDQIGDAHEIVGFRNRLIHAYHVVDSDVVWDAIQQHVPPLERSVRALLGPG